MHVFLYQFSEIYNSIFSRRSPLAQKKAQVAPGNLLGCFLYLILLAMIVLKQLEELWILVLVLKWSQVWDYDPHILIVLASNVFASDLFVY